MGRSEKDRDLERLIPVGTLALDVTKINGSESSDQSPSPSSPFSHHSAKEAFGKDIHSWVTKKFMSGCVILFPIAITFYLTWKLINFVDGFFSPIYIHLGIDVFDEDTHAFKEVAIIRHPRLGEYAFGFITSIIILRKSTGAEELCCVYVPTNHLYLGDVFLLNSKDIMRPNLSVREGIEIVISGGMSVPKILTIVDAQSILSPRVGKFAVPQV